MPAKIGENIIGNGHPCFVIAEAGVNHNGQMDLAFKLVDAAKDAGANAVKFQTFKTEKVVSPIAPKAEYQVANTESAGSQLDMIRKLELTFNEFRQLHAYCAERKILFLSTPFDTESADFLNELGMTGFKIPSGEITNFPLVAHVARMQKPIIMSTGMANMGEVTRALEEIYTCGNRDVVLLHCVSNYPAEPSSINLRAMATMREEFRVDVGYSDHTRGIEIPLAAVALGACVIEKHFTLDKNLPGPDHKASLEPHELREMVRCIRNVEASLGNGKKIPTADELKTADAARRSLVAARRILAGTVITDEMIAILRPGTGLQPAMKPSVVGKRLLRNLDEGELFALENLG